MSEDSFPFHEGPIAGETYQIVTTRFFLNSPTGLSAFEISNRLRIILDPFEVKLNFIQITSGLIFTKSFCRGVLTDDLRVPLSNVIEDKQTFTITFFEGIYVAPNEQDPVIENEEEEEPTPAAPPLDGLLVILLAFLFT